jgi:DNA polymerase III subunit delta
MAAKRKEKGPASKAANLHFIHGSDEAAVKETALALVRALAPPEAGEFGTEIIDGAADNADHAARICRQTMEALQTLPLFGSSKLVWLKNATFLADTPTGRAETTLEALGHLLALVEPGLHSDVQFILSASVPDQRRTFFLRLSDTATTQVFDVPDSRGGDAQLEALVAARASTAGLTFDPEAMALFLLLAGDRTQQIANELEKLDLYLGSERRHVTIEDVRTMVPLTRTGVIFELGNAVGRRETRRALALVGPLLQQGETAVGLLLAAIVPKMRNLLLVGDLLERFQPSLQSYPAFVRSLESLPEQEVAHLPRKKDGGLNVYPLFLAAQDNRNFTTAELRAGLQACLRANHRLVGSSLAPDVVLSQLIVEITIGTRRRPAPAQARP